MTYQKQRDVWAVAINVYDTRSLPRPRYEVLKKFLAH